MVATDIYNRPSAEGGGKQEQQDDETVLQELVSHAGSRQHLEREKALRALDGMADHFEGKDESSVFAEVVRKGAENMFGSVEWEERLGGLKVSELLVRRGLVDDDFALKLCKVYCMDLLEDSEVRVRWAVGELLGELSKVCQSSVSKGSTLHCHVWELTGNTILKSIEKNYSRDAEDGGEPSSKFAPKEHHESDPIASLLQQSYQVVEPGKGDMRHGTEGWKCLETSFRALNNIMKGSGDEFRQYLDDEILALVYKSLKHPNRFIREICQFMLGTVCEILNEDELFEKHVELSGRLGFGLSDNWSQVRYAASVATRKFVLATPHYKDEILPLLVPHMCLNRYYVAEGVRTYSQETWRLAVGDEGKDWVARCIQNVVSYYVEQSGANNHAVREAACACIAELMVKVDRSAVSPHVPRLLSCLLTCFRDASWPVRDAACLATGRCVLAFPEESRDILEKLYKLWFAHLEENIFSVREDSAVALANAARAYGDEAITRITQKLDEMLLKAKNQESDSKSLSKLENVTTFGVAAARAKIANDKDSHTDKTMFSCGSLAPKLKRGADCCGDYGINRPAEPWESSDGSIYMVRELAAVSPEAVVPFIPALAELGNLCHFTHYVTLHETLWHCLPVIAERVGKKVFKQHLELFLDSMLKDLQCDHRLCQAAAATCISKLQKLIGKGIFLGRLTEQQLQDYERSMTQLGAYMI